MGVLAKPMDELKDYDTNKIFESNDMMSMVYYAPAFVEDVRTFMPILLSEGYLD